MGFCGFEGPGNESFQCLLSLQESRTGHTERNKSKARGEELSGVCGLKVKALRKEPEQMFKLGMTSLSTKDEGIRWQSVICLLSTVSPQPTAFASHPRHGG